MIDLIFCGSGGNNDKFGKIALEEGWLYGSQPRCKQSLPVTFVDLDFKNISAGYLDRYCRFVETHCPKYAVLPDIIVGEDLQHALNTADRIAYYVENFIVVPKLKGVLQEVPRHINGKKVLLGYPCSGYGAKMLMNCVWDFQGWENGVHLLGGTLKKQMWLSNYLHITSIDCRQHMIGATYGYYWQNGKQVRDATYTPKHDRIVDLFRVSCRDIKNQWEKAYMEV